MDIGLTYTEAAQWANGTRYLDPAAAAATARAYRNYGFTAPEGLAWYREDFTPDEATAFTDNVWTPSAASALYDAVEEHLWATAPAHPLTALLACMNDWLTLGLPPERTLLYIRARCTTEEANRLEAHRLD